VTAEHSACFPEAGPIAVKSLQVKHRSLPTDFVLFGFNQQLPAALISQVQNDDGSLFYLNDHVPVEAAFRWDKGPWKLLVEARELGSRTPARSRGCGSRKRWRF
jgi:hypothetical protein